MPNATAHFTRVARKLLKTPGRSGARAARKGSLPLMVLQLEARDVPSVTVLDNFTDPTPSTPLVGLAAPVNTQVVRTDTLASGADRTITVTQTAVDGSGTDGATQYLVGSNDGGVTGQLDLATAPATTANVDSNYQYSTPLNLSGTGGTFSLAFLYSDHGVPFAITLTDGHGNSATQTGVDNTSAATFTFNLSGFTGVDLTDVTGVDVLVNAGASTVTSADFILSSLSVTLPDPNVTLIKTADAPSVNAGGQAGFTVTIADASGAGAATGVSLSDPLPTEAGTPLNWTIDPSSPNASAFVITGGNLQLLNNGSTTLAAGTSLVVHVVATTVPTASPLTVPLANTAAVTGTNVPTVPPATATENVLSRTLPSPRRRTPRASSPAPRPGSRSRSRTPARGPRTG
ncbi:hypothetical protein [Fimbriiglobus ruber]|uniref:Fibronectin type III domain protein n=1 Tax=Fimbriiglobus ruber TaxID=1908690 RepID=A0A225DY83_9BACT|nr:hypothetical protein [Fimbriiglobus ruber]OWK41087.1 fibronectin type III domain protein [Fimbriiglobus ruber]